jgi:hypothetical protein
MHLAHSAAHAAWARVRSWDLTHGPLARTAACKADHAHLLLLMQTIHLRNESQRQSHNMSSQRWAVLLLHENH